jgi:hypothetical protein
MHSPRLLELYAHERIVDLQHEAANERLIAESRLGGRSMRARLAGGLYALAARIDDRAMETNPRLATA